jgi:transcriptional regulator with XRE-family HTH domain
MATDPTSSNSKPEAPALWARIDELCTRRGVTTQALAEAAGVTWAAAKRWRLPPEKNGSEPDVWNVAAIAGALHVTVDELLGIYKGNEPDFESWREFKKTAIYGLLTERERVLVAASPFDVAPPLASYLALAEAHITARSKA